MKYAIGFFFGMVLTTLFFSWYMRQQWSGPIPVKETLTTTEDAQSETADFDAFYERFHTDSAYQMSHILFPLEGIAARDSSYVPTEGVFRWKKDAWQLHRKFNDMDGTFTRDFVRMGEDLVVENIQLASGRYGMQRRYAKYEDGWYLIFYAAMNELVVKEEEEEPAES